MAVISRQVQEVVIQNAENNITVQTVADDYQILASAATTAVLDTAAYYTGTNVEDVLAELGDWQWNLFEDFVTTSQSAGTVAATYPDAWARRYTFENTNSSTNTTLTLPAIASVADNRFWFAVFVEKTSLGDVTIDPNLSELINEAATIDLRPGSFAIIGPNDAGTEWTALYSNGIDPAAVSENIIPNNAGTAETAWPSLGQGTTEAERWNTRIHYLNAMYITRNLVPAVENDDTFVNGQWNLGSYSSGSAFGELSLGRLNLNTFGDTDPGIVTGCWPVNAGGNRTTTCGKATNRWAAAYTDSVVLANGNNGVSIVAGSGVPSIVLDNGSIYMRTDGTGPNLYVRENATWVAK